MRTRPLGYVHVPIRPFFSSTPLACGFGRRTLKRGVHTRYAHCAYPSGVPEGVGNRATKTGAALHCAAPPRLYFGITCVSARSLTASDSMSGPAPQLLSTTQSEQRVGRRWRVRSPEATGSRSRGRRVQTLLSDRCSLDSPPLPVALWVATIVCYSSFLPHPPALHRRFRLLRGRSRFTGRRHNAYVVGEKLGKLAARVHAQTRVGAGPIRVHRSRRHVQPITD